MRELDHIWFVLAAFLAALGCFTAVSLVGATGQEVLRDVLLGLGGALGGVAVAKGAGPK